MSIKPYYFTRSIDLSVQKRIMDLFYTMHDNTDRNIAEIMGMKQSVVCALIKEHLDLKMERINKQINERYEKANEIKRFKRKGDARLSSLASHNGKESDAINT